MAKKKKTTKPDSPESTGQAVAAGTPAREESIEAPPTREAAIVVEETGERDTVWLACSGAIIALSAILRFVMLGLKPFHHDEGVNGFFLTTLFKDGIYKYDPANYHGPTLYYISLAFAKVFGLETVPVRVSMAIFGVLMVVLCLYLKRYIGKTGTLIAALFLALSPGMVFISRYFIHEIFFVFLGLGVVLSVLLFIEKRRAGPGAIAWMSVLLFTALSPFALRLAKFVGGDNESALFFFRLAFLLASIGAVYYFIRKLLTWDEGRPLYLVLAASCVSLFFATKETAFITLGTQAIACVCVWIWRQIRESVSFQKNWFGAVLAVHAVVIVGALAYKDTISDAATFLSQAFYPVGKPSEGFVFYAVVFLIFGAIAAWVLFLSDLRKSNLTEYTEPTEITWGNFVRSMGTRADVVVLAAAMATTFIYLGVLFFSSFFTYSEGVGKAFEAYAIWTKTGNKDHTQNGFFGYMKWGMKIEAPIMVLSILGSLIALMKGKHRFAIFTAFWAMGLLLAYSIIPYKTPWLALSFLLPMCIVAGYGLGQMYHSGSDRQKYASAALAGVAVLLLGYQTYQHNFVRYDDEDMPYVYAHTRRGLLDMVAEIDRYAKKSGKGGESSIEVVSPDYWPLTWYLAPYKANFHGTLVDSTTSEFIIAKKNDQDTEMIRRYSNHYKYAGVYPLRPGVNLVLLVRKDIAEPKDQDINKVTEYKAIPGVTS